MRKFYLNTKQLFAEMAVMVTASSAQWDVAKSNDWLTDVQL